MHVFHCHWQGARNSFHQLQRPHELSANTIQGEHKPNSNTIYFTGQITRLNCWMIINHKNVFQR